MLVPPVPTLTSGTSTDIEHYKYIGSYNWTETSYPAVIIVPGSAPEWTGRSLPIKVTPDRGVQFVDQNGFRCPSSILLPLFKSVDALGKTVDWPAIDFVTDRNGLRKLSRWISGGDVKDFRIDMELAGEHTILLNRWEAQTRTTFLGKSYGFGFEQATTAAVPGCEKSTGHHRIVKFKFFGLNMVVRYEVDACLPSASPKKHASRASQSSNPDDLADALAGLNITSSKPANTLAVALPLSPQASSASPPLLRIVHAGAEQPQESIIELTTRSENYIHKLNWAEIFPQLYLSQTPHFYTGVHSAGRFFEVREQRLDGLEMVSQREKAETGLRKLGKVLKMIQEIVVKHGKAGRLSLVCEEGTLKVYEWVSVQSCLPAEVMRRFEK